MVNIRQLLDNPIPVTISGNTPGSTTITTATVTVTTSSTEIAAANSSRSSLLIRNKGDVSIYLALGEAATTSDLELEANGDLQLSGGQAVNGITASGTATVQTMAEVLA
jgi:hypothetical protein